MKWMWQTAAYIFAISVVAAATAQSRPAGGSRDAAWTMFRGDAANTGVARADLPEKLRLRWKFDTLEARTATSSPTSSTSKPVAEPIESTAAIVDGVVYFGSDDSHVYALALSDGKEKWRFKARESVRSSPSIVENTLFVGDDAGSVYALDVSDGRKRWEFQTQDEIIASPVPFEDKLLIASYDGALYAIAQSDGKQIWKYATEDKLHATPAAAEGHALIAGCDGKLHVVKLSDGSGVRKINIGGPSGSAAAIAGEVAYLATQSNQVLALNWKSGEVVWLFEDPDRQFPFLSSAAIGERSIFVGGRDKRFRAIDRQTGKTVWTYVTKRKMDVSAVLVGRRIFGADENGDIFALDAETGDERWKYETGSGFVASPAVGEKCLVIGSLDGVIYCFGA